MGNQIVGMPVRFDQYLGQQFELRTGKDGSAGRCRSGLEAVRNRTTYFTSLADEAFFGINLHGQHVDEYFLAEVTFRDFAAGVQHTVRISSTHVVL